MSVVSRLAPNDPRHGTANGYQNLNCRCDACRTAYVDYARSRGISGYRRVLCECGNKKTPAAKVCTSCQRASVAASHGTETMFKYGCRCEPCRLASNAARRLRRRTPNVAVHGRNASYGSGCRCDECREAHTVYCRERRRLKAAVMVADGTPGVAEQPHPDSSAVGRVGGQENE